jgi:hypothetical protein
MPGYALPMTHPYGITLNRVWTEWATNYGVSSTVAAAVFLISEARPIHEVTAKLAPDEFEQVADIVSRWPDCFPPGTPAALKSRRQTPSLDSPAVSVSTVQEPQQRPVGTSPEMASERQARVLRAAHLLGRKPGTRPGTRAETARRRMVVEELMKAGLSVRTISIATDIPPTSVHRAMRAVARAEAKQEIAVLKIMDAFLEKSQHRRSKGRGWRISART